MRSANIFRKVLMSKNEVFMGNGTPLTVNCKIGISAKLRTLKTWFASGV